MPRYRSSLPQLSGDIFLTDAGLETDLIFNHGIEIREFAAHTLLPTPQGRAALTRYFEGFLRLAKEMDTGFILDSVTWKAHAHWASSLHASRAELRAANEDSLRFSADLRERFGGNAKPIVLNAVTGPRGDAYRPEAEIAMEAAEDYFTEQLGWLAVTEADMVTARPSIKLAKLRDWPELLAPPVCPRSFRSRWRPTAPCRRARVCPTRSSRSTRLLTATPLTS